MKFELFKGRDGQFYFNIVSTNGQVVASSEGYTQKKSAIQTITSIVQSIAQSYSDSEKIQVIDKTK